MRRQKAPVGTSTKEGKSRTTKPGAGKNLSNENTNTGKSRALKPKYSPGQMIAARGFLRDIAQVSVLGKVK
jgi:hypothetical protein